MKLTLIVVCVVVAAVALVDGRSLVKRRYARQAPPATSVFPPPGNVTTAGPPPENNTTTFGPGCMFNPCLNGGSCYSYGNWTGCNCPSGWNGQYCEYYWQGSSTWSPSTISQDSCSSYPCKNGGSCFPLDMFVGTYYCVCQHGFTGYDCSDSDNNNHNNSSVPGLKLNLFLSLLTVVEQK